MRITELLTKETIHLSIKGQEKRPVIDELVEVLNRSGKLSNPTEFKKEILNREDQGTTGIGDGIAIPHAKTRAVKQPAIAFGRSVEGVDYESLDGQPSHLFFMIAAPEGGNSTHLEALARLSTILMNEEVRKLLLEANTESDVLNIIDRYDQEDEQEEQSMSGDKKFIVAVTACPTGIAHTYMSADSLKAKATEMGVDIKVETNGSGGAKNVLTQQEIESAVAVIVAADTKVEMGRFNGKHVIEVPVADGIHKSGELIDKALNQDVPIYQGENDSRQEGTSNAGKRGIGSTIYKHLMNGVSNMLPFIVGGGILIAISFLFGYNAFDPNDPSYHPLAEALMTIGGRKCLWINRPCISGIHCDEYCGSPRLCSWYGRGNDGCQR
ncbi:fructose PTS transporter subunit IIA [Bacillus carboniphilus]|uniref:fructose PTS transporter subunit IIA n=1 Tax=Bacillus carboniphilus TaxID=86663 RepID=UPI00353216FD